MSFSVLFRSCLNLFLFSVVFPVFAEPLIVANGKAKAVIVVAEEPTRSARLGASELQAYIEKISGARLEIVTNLSDPDISRIFVSESAAASQVGADAEGLKRDAFRISSGANWLALIGNDLDFQPREPWARNNGEWAREKQAEWEKLAGHPWMNPVGRSLYRSYSRHVDIWTYDHRGSLNAVYAFLRELGVRWYMPGELGEIVPTLKNVSLSVESRTVEPAYEIRSVSRPLLGSNEVDDSMWYLRIGANHLYSVLHHGQRSITEHPEQRALHPEYYGQLANGERDTERATATACLSSEGFFNEVLAFARLMYDHYDVPAVSVMPHDGFQHCQCERCLPQQTLDRGPAGSSSDYVWDFVVRVAKELEKTHPERKVFCGAYSKYRLPPLKIEKLPDNVLMQITNGRPIREVDGEVHAEALKLRREWLAKTNNPLSVTLNYTPFTNRGAFRPQYWPHVIARGIRDSHQDVWREDAWFSSGKGGLHHPAMSHLNPYVMSRLWWDADRDVDVLLKEYYELFYGPAAAEMKTFIEYCEKEFTQLSSDKKRSQTALDLFDSVLGKVSHDTDYGRRIALVDEFLTTFRDRSSQMGVERAEGLPTCRIIDLTNDKWRDARDTLKLDGKIDEPFWTAYNYPRPLKEAQLGRKPELETRFHVRWWKGSLYFGIRCDIPEGEKLVVGALEENGTATWPGEQLELFIETDKHSYYQIVVNPTGSYIDLDRGVDKRNWYDWSSQAEVATHVGEDFWSAELKFPVTSSDEDPLHQIVGNRPFKSRQKDLDSGKGTSLPWHFNLFRKRGDQEDVTVTSFSPLGPEQESFHAPERFAKFFVQ